VRILIAGATGFVGSRLASALDADGHRVVAMTRHPDRYEGAGTPVGGDVSRPGSLAEAMDGAEVAYYLVHSLDSDDFADRDAAAAAAFGASARAAGVGRIVYLGGLGADDPAQLPPHLRSRREVETLLADAGVPVTVLRAAMVVGDGGLSWEITRQLARRLPVMVTPRWVNTQSQPIALADAVRYLVAMAAHPAVTGRVLEIGGADVLTYAEMLRRTGRIDRGRAGVILGIPLLTPALSSLWISLVTDVDSTTARHLIESMVTPVVVRDRSILELVPGEPLGYDEMVERALRERSGRLRRSS
jgi:uncharacterized protein YbjT (DUF2867 family)